MAYAMAATSREPHTAATTTICAVHADIIQTHILTRLDGPALASAASTCSQLYTLSSNDHLWANACNSTWPSTTETRVRHVISMFPNGYRSFFSDSFPSSRPSATATTAPINPDHTPELISAVDLFHRQILVLSKVAEIETVTGWFRCSPFRVDMLDPKDVVRTRVNYLDCEDTCHDFAEDLRLSWIVIDPVARRAVNVSSEKAVSVQRHWLTGEVQVRFATVVIGEKGTATEMVLCNVVVTLGGEKNNMHVREVSLQVEDMDGKQLSGRDSLVILKRALESERNGKEGYMEFVKRKKEREEMKVRVEGRLDMMFVVFAALTFASLFVLWRWKW